MLKSYKYLGVIRDNKLSCAEHIYLVKSTLLKGSGVFYKTRYFLNEKSMNLVFKFTFNEPYKVLFFVLRQK